MTGLNTTSLGGTFQIKAHAPGYMLHVIHSDTLRLAHAPEAAVVLSQPVILTECYSSNASEPPPDVTQILTCWIALHPASTFGCHTSCLRMKGPKCTLYG
jgi:hypothetical protein